ncbi:MAG: sensor histidine kinase [Spirochaetota bacterium]
MKAGSLFSRSFMAHLVSLLLVSLLITGTVFVSLRRSVDIWNVNRGQRLENLILPILADVYRREGALEPDTIHDQLRHILTANVYAYVFSRERDPVYFYSLGRRTLLYDQAAVADDLERLREQDQALTPIVDGRDIIGYLTADTVGFTNDASNRRLLLSISSAVIGGAVAAVVLALATAWFFAASLAREARMVASALRLIAGGRRDVEIGRSKTNELRAIGDSAASLQAQLAREERIRRQWMEDIAHDLRTPVTALRTQLEGIADGYLAPESERLASLQEEVKHVEWLVSGLRELSHIESPETEVEFYETDLCEFVDTIVRAIVTPDSVEPGQPTVRCEGKTRARVAPHLLRRAVENVVVNAFQYVDDEGRIDVAVRQDGDECLIDVANTGTVDPDVAPRFFDRLYRDPRTSGRGGSGLGLPIALSAVERHGGSMRIDQRGSWTHVTIRLRRNVWD